MNTIQEEIKIASKEVSNSSKIKILTFEEKANKYLDFLLARRKEIDGLTEIIHNLNERLIIEINASKDLALEIKSDLQKLVNACQRFIAIIKRSDIYSGVKESTLNFTYEVRNLNEILYDIEIRYIKLPNNPEMKNIISKIQASK
ncbi:MAG: hypothetical protein HY958_13385 [Bacteroidia bacterium]|nr:hypothetical protein [Bacteroidia bacterium]